MFGDRGSVPTRIRSRCASLTAYWSQVSKVFGGTVVAQAIPFVSTLWLARLVDPAAYGSFTVWLGVAMIFSVIVTGRFEISLAVASDGHPRKAALLGTVVVTVAVSLIVLILTLVAWVFSGQNSVPADLPKSLFLLIAPCAAFVALSQVWQSWYAAEGWYAQLSIFRITQAALVAFTQLTFAMVWPAAEALALGYCMAVMTAIVIASRKTPLPRVTLSRSRASLNRLWERHRRFLTYSLPADALNTTTSYLPAMFIAVRFGSESAGYLAIALTFLGAPIGLLGKSVLDVFKRHAAVSFRLHGQCEREYRQTFLVLFAGSLVTLAVALPTLNKLIVFLFGPAWEPSAQIAGILLPLFLLRFVASPLSYMTYIANKQNWDLVWQICLTIIVILSLTLPESLTDTVAAYSVGYSLMYVIYLWISYRLSKGWTH